MKANTSVLAKRYAKAYDALAKDNADAKVNAALFEGILSSLQPVEDYLNNPTIPSSVKQDIVSKAYRVQDKALNFVKTLIAAGRFYLAAEISKELKELLDKRLGIKRITVTSAQELDDTAKRSISNALSKYFNSVLVLDFKTNAALLSGITVRCGDTVIDGSAQGRLEQMAKILTER